MSMPQHANVAVNRSRARVPEIVIVAPDAVADEAEAKLIKVMSTPPGWAHDLPVACDWGMADNYGDT